MPLRDEKQPQPPPIVTVVLNRDAVLLICRWLFSAEFKGKSVKVAADLMREIERTTGHVMTKDTD